MKKFFIFFLIFNTLPIRYKFLVFGGKTGWIGQKIVKILSQNKDNIVIAAKSRLEYRDQIEKELISVNPDYIINASGKVGRPNIDWCEDHKEETIRTNIIGSLNLIDIAYSFDIPVINIGTGCIYEYDEQHQMNSGIGFTEYDEPNFNRSFYSKTKIFFEKLVNNYSNVLNLRIRMPISSDLSERNFITKISKYKKVINIPNSVTILDDLLPLIPEMAKMSLRGNFNFVNPGTISHNEILDLYKEIVDKNFTYKNFSIKEQNNLLKAERSNNELDCSKLLNYFPNIPSAKKSIIKVLSIIKEDLK